MIKKYIKPETQIYTVLNKSLLMLSVTEGSEMNYEDHENLITTTGDADGAEGEYSRNSNGCNIWDNAW